MTMIPNFFYYYNCVLYIDYRAILRKATLITQKSVSHYFNVKQTLFFLISRHYESIKMLTDLSFPSEITKA